MKTGVKVLDAMTNKPVTANVEDTVTNCAKKMKKYRVGSLLLKENRQVKGIITENDMVYKVIAKGLNPDDTTAGDIMESDMITISPSVDIFEALVEMRESQIRRLPVEDDGKIIGLLTMKDVLKIEPQLFDVLVEKMDLREENRKPIPPFDEYEEGVCEACGNYSYRLAEDSGMKVCPNCSS